MIKPALDRYEPVTTDNIMLANLETVLSSIAGQDFKSTGKLKEYIEQENLSLETPKIEGVKIEEVNQEKLEYRIKARNSAGIYKTGIVIFPPTIEYNPEQTYDVKIVQDTHPGEKKGVYFLKVLTPKENKVFESLDKIADELEREIKSEQPKKSEEKPKERKIKEEDSEVAKMRFKNYKRQKRQQVTETKSHNGRSNKKERPSSTSRKQKKSTGGRQEASATGFNMKDVLGKNVKL
jgi:hypothetical protein